MSNVIKSINFTNIHTKTDAIIIFAKLIEEIKTIFLDRSVKFLSIDQAELNHSSQLFLNTWITLASQDKFYPVDKLKHIERPIRAVGSTMVPTNFCTSQLWLDKDIDTIYNAYIVLLDLIYSKTSQFYTVIQTDCELKELVNMSIDNYNKLKDKYQTLPNIWVCTNCKIQKYSWPTYDTQRNPWARIDYGQYNTDFCGKYCLLPNYDILPPGWKYTTIGPQHPDIISKYNLSIITLNEFNNIITVNPSSSDSYWREALVDTCIFDNL